MITLWRRFLVLAVFTTWLGGLTFYGAVVVPVGRTLLGAQQSLVTREVSLYLIWLGLAALLPLAWDLYASGTMLRLRLLLWCCLAATAPALGWLHGRLALHMDDPSLESSLDFYSLHRVYLLLSTLQWCLGVVQLAVIVKVWREEDGAKKMSCE